MKKPSLKERISYWFDTRMARGSLGLIKVLLLVTIAVIVTITLIITAFGLSDAPGETLWDSFATVINAWMPYSEDGEIGYRILMTLGAVAGLLVTSVLIGIFTSAIEEKITSLRRGNSQVLEEGHTLILGFISGEYTLLRQLILAENGEKRTIVIAGDMERDEMEEEISDNVDVPKNIKIVCRKIDLSDSKGLLRCAADTAAKIVVKGATDAETTRILLAVSDALINSGNDTARICAVMENEQYLFPDIIARKHKIRTLSSGDIVARIIAHSCTEPGLSETFRDIFNFEGCEFYINKVPAATGLSFRDVVLKASGGIPVGILRDGKAFLVPDPAEEIRLTDELIVFAETTKDLLMTEAVKAEGESISSGMLRVGTEDAGKVLILGSGEKMSMVLSELPENVHYISFVENESRDNDEAVRKVIAERGYAVEYCTADIRDREDFCPLLRDVKHVIILSDDNLSDDDADTENIFRILLLRDLRVREGLSFSITAEMRKERNEELLRNDDGTDFIVASNMSCYFLAQLSENAGGCSVLRELLSNAGSELRLVRPEEMGIRGPVSVSELRRKALSFGCIFLGVTAKTEHRYENRMALDLSDTVNFGKADQMILIGDL